MSLNANPKIENGVKVTATLKRSYNSEAHGGGLTEEQVREIVAEETDDLVAKSERDEFVKGGLTEPEETWTDEDKAKACKTIGAVGKLDNSTAMSAGLASAYIADKDNKTALLMITEFGATPNTIVKRGSRGEVKVANPEKGTDAVNKAYADGENEKLSKEIAVINLALEQSGLVKKYKQPITQEYTERVTADGANVLDGSKAVLKKIVGSTVACTNYFNAEVATVATETTASAFISRVSQGSVTVKTISGYVGLGLAYTEKTLADFCPKLKVGQTVYFNADISGEPFQKALYLAGISIYWMVGTSQTITQDMLNAIVAFVGLRSNIDATNVGEVVCSNIRITENASEPYQPYFTGLKSASFGGIESKNADGTETATLAFTKTETPLGTTIDFEQKKITDYGVEIVFKGTAEDGISYYQYGANENRRNGIRLRLVNSENFAKGISTDGVIAENASQLGTTAQIAIGYNNSTDLFWVGFIDDIGITTKGQAPADTNAVMQQVQAYLAQRYADGNPVTIRYLSSVLQSETNFTNGNEYTAWKGGTEKVLENDGNEYGADNTLTQDYILVTEVK